MTPPTSPLRLALTLPLREPRTSGRSGGRECAVRCQRPPCFTSRRPRCSPSWTASTRSRIELRPTRTAVGASRSSNVATRSCEPWRKRHGPASGTSDTRCFTRWGKPETGVRCDARHVPRGAGSSADVAGPRPRPTDAL